MRRLVTLALVTACGPSGETQPDGATEAWACPQVRSVSGHCGELLFEPVYVTLIDKSSAQPNEVGLLGAISGNTCTLAKFPATEVLDFVTTLAVLGADVFYCASTDAEASGKLTRVSLATGAVTTSNLSCIAITSFEDKLLVKIDTTSPIQEYASFDLVQSNTPTPRDIGTTAVRLGAGEGKIYSSSPMVEQIFVYDPATSMTSQIAMPGSGIHVTGLASQKGQIAILDGISFDQWIYSFDGTTGAPLGKVVAATQVTRLHGLSNACRLPAFE
jgi:hypothetical protein